MTRLLRTRDVAEILNVSVSALLRWTREGHIPSVRLPSGVLRYRREDVDAFLADRTGKR